jgi:hypothetical protein
MCKAKVDVSVQETVNGVGVGDFVARLFASHECGIILRLIEASTLFAYQHDYLHFNTGHRTRRP